MDIWVAILSSLFSIAIIVMQIIFLIRQKIEFQRLKNDYMEFKATIEGVVRNEVDEVILQNKKLIHTINQYFKSKN